MQNLKFVWIGFVDAVFYPMSTLNDVKNYLELKSYPMVFNNPLLICLIISPLDRIGSCVWENWKKEKKLWLTSKSTQQCLLMTLLTLLFLLENNFTVMTRISVRFVTYQSDHYTEQIVERRKYYFCHKCMIRKKNEMWHNPWLSLCQDFHTFCSLLEL